MRHKLSLINTKFRLLVVATTLGKNGLSCHISNNQPEGVVRTLELRQTYTHLARILFRARPVAYSTVPDCEKVALWS